jgi:RimJ/RimL family protein N-acetyltransferase
MDNWIKHPLTLNGQMVDLFTLNKDHFSELEALAADKRIWEFYVYDGSNPTRYRSVLKSALEELQKGTQLPFVIFHKKEKRLVGSTRFLDIQSVHRKLEIGSTWLHPDYWGTEINLECKLLQTRYVS